MSTRFKRCMLLTAALPLLASCIPNDPPSTEFADADGFSDLSESRDTNAWDSDANAPDAAYADQSTRADSGRLGLDCTDDE